MQNNYIKNCNECERKKTQINCNCFKRFEYLDRLTEEEFVIEAKRLAEKIKEKLNLL